MIKQFAIILFLAMLNMHASATTLPGGTYKVGTKPGDNFSTLFEAIKAVNSGISGPVILLLTDTSYTIDSTTVLSIEPTAGTSAFRTITIRPDTGVTTKISGLIKTAIFKIHGAGYITIDGNNFKANKNLIITNNSRSYLSSVIWLADSSANYVTTHNTIQNCMIYGDSITTTLAGIFSGGSTTGAYSYAKGSNSYNTIRNNTIARAQNGIYILGASTAVLDNGLQIVNNILGTSTDGDGFNESGITAKYQANATIRGNDIQNLVCDGSSTVFKDGQSDGINVGLYLFNSRNTRIDSNKIHNIKFSGSITGLCYGLSLENFAFNTSDQTANNYVYNNMIYDVINSGYGHNRWLFSGINENGGYNDQFYFNTVYISQGFSSATAGNVAAFSNGNTGNTTASHVIVIKDNIFDIDNITEGNVGLGFYCNYSTLTNIDAANAWDANDLYFNISQNYGTGFTGYFNGKKDTTLKGWQTATGMEVISHNIKPIFLSTASPIDVHLTNSDGNLNFGVPITSPILIATDIDGDLRSAATPDVGADELKIILPVKLLNFTAQKQNNTSLLQWQTTNEINNSYYSIERSADSKTFSSIGTKQGLNSAATNNYAFTDNAPLKGINYYRLKQVDKDGKFSFSGIASVEFIDGGVFAIAPNPANNSIKIIIPASNTISEIMIYDITGKKVMSEEVAANITLKQININRLASGVYNVVLVQDGKKEMMKLVKK